MYHSEQMICMMEDMQRQAADMERNVKDMMEMEGRAFGIELDKRKNARELMHQLMEHMESAADMPPMTWAYVPHDDAMYDTATPPTGDWQVLAEVNMDEHTHDDGTVHSHPHDGAHNHD
tara:strand:- start:53 stop:409 length:357 start_codon:yes stop_codon:yes gene_type:complete